MLEFDQTYEVNLLLQLQNHKPPTTIEMDPISVNVFTLGLHSEQYVYSGSVYYSL